ncbi:tRNA pseudouridine(55) synthase TruB [Blattabacterium cuenoti]|uniref:tRNA pseudouridine(55) synthase TruB n=1 Tax=Blattabacterium cuenoti TaxID=1653831 RepID=UPI00163C029D|nr:tRNA pseudouridine(55) synthase TruB [Blattabacterium cuenoti]
MIEYLHFSEFQKGKIFLVDKPWGWTSFEVVKKMKNFLINSFPTIHNKNSLKIGHAGTLDPLATGLLIILLGKKTKKTEEIHCYRKIYTGIIKLGCETPSFDSETNEYNFSSISHITPHLVETVSKQFIGEIHQIPPSFSSLKKKGKRFYKYARFGEKMDFIRSRKITIYQFRTIKIRIPYIKFFIECGKGTYIRSLAKDFGIALKSTSYLLSLRRERIGKYSINRKDMKVVMKLQISNKYPCYVF